MARGQQNPEKLPGGPADDNARAAKNAGSGHLRRAEGIVKKSNLRNWRGHQNEKGALLT